MRCHERSIPLTGPKALMRTKQDTQSFSLSFLYFFVSFFGRWGWAECGQVRLCSYNECIQKKKKKRFCVALFFSTAHPAYSAQRSERVNHGSFPTFSGDNPNNLFPAFETGGNTEMKTSDCTPNATNLFLRNEASVSPSHILNRMVMMLNLFLCFYLFLTLKLGG